MEDDLASQIPSNAKEFKYENMFMKFTKSHDGSITGFIAKNIETPYLHYHIYKKENKLFFHQTVEGIKKVRLPVDIEKALQTLGKLMEHIFSKAEIVQQTDERFASKTVVFIHKFNLQVDQIRGNEVRFSHNVEQNQLPFEKMDVSVNWFGVILDENNVETHMIFCKDRQIFVIDLIEMESEELVDIMNPKKKYSKYHRL